MLQCLPSDRFSVAHGENVILEKLVGGLTGYKMVYEYSNNIFSKLGHF